MSFDNQKTALRIFSVNGIIDAAMFALQQRNAVLALASPKALIANTIFQSIRPFMPRFNAFLEAGFYFGVPSIGCFLSYRPSSNATKVGLISSFVFIAFQYGVSSFFVGTTSSSSKPGNHDKPVIEEIEEEEGERTSLDANKKDSEEIKSADEVDPEEQEGNVDRVQQKKTNLSEEDSDEELDPKEKDAKTEGHKLDRDKQREPTEELPIYLKKDPKSKTPPSPEKEGPKSKISSKVEESKTGGWAIAADPDLNYSSEEEN